jgi:CRP/FNR family transcriptional regulator, cyclic AMP receptor protein
VPYVHAPERPPPFLCLTIRDLFIPVHPATAVGCDHDAMASKSKQPRDAQAFLNSASLVGKSVRYRRAETIFSQGDACDSVIYLQKGRVKLSAVSEAGRKAIVGMLGPGDFFGEGCLAGQSVRIGTATAMTPTTALVIEKREMFRGLHAEHALSDRFIDFMLTRNIQIEQDLVEQLFNSVEKRLARTLLLLAHYGEQGKPLRILPRMLPAVLAGIVGTTPERVTVFMSKFKRLGFVQGRADGLRIDKSLLNVVLRD